MNLSVIYKHILHEEKLEKAYFQTEKKNKKRKANAKKRKTHHKSKTFIEKTDGTKT